jgi:hypothetical protein
MAHSVPNKKNSKTLSGLKDTLVFIVDLMAKKEPQTNFCTGLLFKVVYQNAQLTEQKLAKTTRIGS